MAVTRWRQHWVGCAAALAAVPFGLAWVARLLGDDPLHTYRFSFLVVAALCVLQTASRLHDAMRPPVSLQ